jgi:Protein of unknown function (DUF726)
MKETAAKNGLLNVFSGSKSLADMFSGENLKSIKNFGREFVGGGAQTFEEARENSKKAGKLLAHFVTSNYFSKGHTVTLIGFSLGTQLIRSTLNRLHKLGRGDIVHNVYLTAGATIIKLKKENKLFHSLAQVVNGRIVNVHTENDTTLAFFQAYYRDNAIGRTIIYQKHPSNTRSKAEGPKLARVDNYDVS